MTYDPRYQPPQQPQHVNLPGAQPWPPPQPQQPYAPQQWQPGGPVPQFPREAVSMRDDLSQLEKIAWAVAVMCTCGLALPFYLARKRQARRRTVTRYR